ncbi:MAG: membrane dipeptidase, partial [Planctomycetes bacterium]|nr:membrane dipeptidase [Planctomycetota bacterium]
LGKLLDRKVGGSSSAEVPPLHVTAERCRAGNVRLLLAACFTQDGDPEARARIDGMLDLARGSPGAPEPGFVAVRSPADFATLPAGTTGICITIENSHVLGDEPSLLSDWRERGVRAIGLTWNGANSLACGVHAPAAGGLTPRGRDVVREAVHLGVAIDLSHLAPRGVAEVLATGASILATHSNARAVWDHPRNLTDEQLRAIAACGGIVGVNIYPPFLAAPGEASLGAVALHAAHIAEVAGSDRVAFGSDLDGFEPLPPWFEGYAALPRLAAALAAAGFTEEQRAGFLGGNFLAWWRSAPA